MKADPEFERALPRAFLGYLPFLFTRVLFPGEADDRRKPRLLSLFVLLLLPAAMLYGSLDFHLLEPDEGRYAQIPREMVENGEWVVPTLQGEPYLDKPPLMYWLIALSYRLFGVSPESARLVPALCVHLTILLVYWLGRRSVGERSAFWAALLLAVAPGFVSVARLLLLDGLLVLCVTASVLCGFEAVRTGRLALRWWIASAFASGLGFLTKGPIAEVLLFVPLVAYGLLARPILAGARPPARLQHYLLFFTIVFCVNLPWYVAIYCREPEFLKHFFWKHNVLRFLRPFDHLQPVWFYAPILLAGLLPGSLLLAPYLRNLLGKRGEGVRALSPAGGFWLLAGGWCCFFFSCSGSKLPTYILPAYPFLCLALGEFVSRSRWDRAPSLRLAVVAMGSLIATVHQAGMPWYAKERSPFGRPEIVQRYLQDRETVVVCFPRDCNSLAFYSDRSDFDQVATRNVNQLFVDCHHRPRTVILFTHTESLAGFRNTLPPSLEIVETTSLKRKYGSKLLTKVLGSTPWGLCDVAIVAPRGARPGGADAHADRRSSGPGSLATDAQ